LKQNLRTFRQSMSFFARDHNTKKQDLWKNSTIQERRKVIKESADEIKDADTILIIGGGPVGVELASEIVSNYPKKRVRIVTDASTLLTRLPKEAQKLALEFFTKRGCEVIFNEVLNLKPEPGTVNVYKSKSGKLYTADIVLKMVGYRPNNSFLKTSFPEFLDATGFIKVNEYLQLFANGTTRKKYLCSWRYYVINRRKNGIQCTISCIIC